MNTQELTGAGTHGPRESFDQGLLALSTRSVSYQYEQRTKLILSDYRQTLKSRLKLIKLIKTFVAIKDLYL